MKKVSSKIGKLSIFIKTWFISLCSIFLSVSVLFLIVAIFSNSLIYNSQKKDFDRHTKQIITAIKKEDNKKIDAYISRGFTVTLNGSILQFADGSQIDEPQQNYRIESFTDTKYDKKSHFIYLDKLNSEEISIIYPIALSQNEIKDILKRIAPYFLFISFLVSNLMALAYARYFSNKIKKTNKIVDLMGKGVYPEIDSWEEGDEFEELKNNINLMYCQLKSIMRDLNKEMNFVKELEDSRRLFMNGIVHELKTPIMNMSLPIKERLTAETAGEDKAFYLKQLDCLDGMNRLVSELLEISHVGNEDFDEIISLENILEELFQLYEEMLDDKQQQLVYQVESNSMISIPREKLTKVISNLLSNAIKYAPEKSTIKIIAKNEYFEIENEILDLDTMDYSIDELQKPFITTDDTHEYLSHGLGLYLVKSTLQYYDYHFTCLIKDNLFIYRFLSSGA